MYHAINEIIEQANQFKIPISEVILRAEEADTQGKRAEIRSEMHRRLEVMRTSTQKGLERPIRSISGLSNGNAYRFQKWLDASNQPTTGTLLSRAISRALSVGEVNAGMGCIVATPTAGSAGILPAVLFSLQESYSLSDEQLVQGLFTAGGIGTVIAFRANVSGAAGGCQAETGSASAMAAAAAVELLGGNPDQSSQAVAIALANQLGLVCDPVAGLVEVPCIQRNAAAVAQAFVAVDLALSGFQLRIPADEVIDAMLRVGEHMDVRYRETAQGGLAATPTGKLMAREIWSGQ